MGIFDRKNKKENQEEVPSREKKDRKPFNETKLGGILDKGKYILKEHGLDIIELGAKAIKGDVSGVIEEVQDICGKEDTPLANNLSEELRIKKTMIIFEFEKDMYRIETEDKQSARDMYKATGHEKANEIADLIIKYNLVIVFLLVIGEVLVLIYITNSALIGVISSVFGYVISSLLNERLTVIQFFFGSSLGSKAKQGTIEGNLKK